MKKLIYLIIILLTLQLAYAEQFELKQGQIIDYKGIKIKLNSVGSSESLNLKINDLSRLITPTTSTDVYGIKIKLIESDFGFQTAIIDITQSALCLVDIDCNDDKSCTKDICQHGFCTHMQETGCILNKECRAHFTLGEVNNILSYCGRDNDWHPRKEPGELCYNNAECLSNLCVDTCQQLEEVKMAPLWLLLLIGVLLIAEGLFVILKPRLAKKIIKNLTTNFADKTWQTIAVIELIIGLGLIIWALT